MTLQLPGGPGVTGEPVEQLTEITVSGEVVGAHVRRTRFVVNRVTPSSPVPVPATCITRPSLAVRWAVGADPVGAVQRNGQQVLDCLSGCR